MCVCVCVCFVCVCLCVAQWIGRVTPNVVSAAETKNLQLGSTLMVSIHTPSKPKPN